MKSLIHRASTLLFAAGFLTAGVGCSRTPEAENHPLPPEPASSAASGSAAAPSPAPAEPAPMPNAEAAAPASAPAAGELTWDVPARWTTVPNPSAMRKATYRIPKAAGDTDDAEMSVIPSGGGLDANIQRWAGQFDDAKVQRTERTSKAGKLPVTVVEIEGTFKGGGMPGAAPAPPKPGSMLLGAIVGTTDPPTFFKLVGPKKSVAAARADFDALVASFRTR